ncbi:MAG: hypothetical protein ACXVBE_02970 [Bdellovibrionota bacterium]
MKKIFALLTLALLLPNLSARADDGDWKPATPIRQAKIRGRIMKEFVERTAEGVKITAEVVCSFDSLAPVFDVRGKKEFFSLSDTVSCPSTIEDRAVKVTVTGYIGIMDWTPIDQRGVTEAESVKSAMLSLSTFADGSSGAKIPNSLNSFAGTRNLEEKSFVVYLAEPHGFSPNLPAKEEMFSTSVEFIDDAQ